MAAAEAASALDARDLRRGGSWTRRQRAKNALIRLCVRAALALADRLPAPALAWVCRALGLAAWVLAPALRRSAHVAITDALPAADAERLAREAFVEAGASLATTLLLRRPGVRALDLIEVPAASRALLAASGGAVFASAHLGPFELVAAAIAELGHDAVAVVRESYDPALDAVVDRHRVAHGVGVIHRGAPGAAFAIVRALRRGSLVGFLPDLGGRVESVPVRFLGRAFAAPVGPARIAIRAGTGVLVGSLAPPSRPAGRLRLTVEAVRSDGGERELTQRVMTCLERRIEALPRLWPWMAQNRR